MWSGPRNISTAMMRAWENREDCAVSDEPLYAAYLAETGLEHPGWEEIVERGETDWRRVTRMDSTETAIASIDAYEEPDRPAVLRQEEVVHARFVSDAGRVVVALVHLLAPGVGGGHRAVRVVLRGDGGDGSGHHEAGGSGQLSRTTP